MAIVVRLDQVMLNHRIKLLELAEKIGITYANLSNLKNGKVTAIRFSTLESICKELNCQPGDILEYIDDKIIDLINNFAKNDMEKEGAMARLYAYAEIKGEKNLTFDLAKECFKMNEEISIDRIKQIVANYYQVLCDDLISKNRNDRVVRARQLALYLCRTETTASFKEICEKFNIDDTVQFIFACDKIGEELKQDEMLQNDYKNIINELNV